MFSLWINFASPSAVLENFPLFFQCCRPNLCYANSVDTDNDPSLQALLCLSFYFHFQPKPLFRTMFDEIQRWKSPLQKSRDERVKGKIYMYGRYYRVPNLYMIQEYSPKSKEPNSICERTRILVKEFQRYQVTTDLTIISVWKSQDGVNMQQGKQLECTQYTFNKIC